ncbi:hypothetical protein [Streptomyces mirabilis]|uniref:hypothetical protein n=1 Tax=Streptomyces mirabilis TaxID=68239 RepID=UPI0033193762
MSENPQVNAIREHIETRERELAGQAEQFRARIEELTQHLGETDAESESLRITRKTLLTLAMPSPATEPAPTSRTTPPTSRSADAGQPMCARDLCKALGLPILPKNTEGIRSKLKRLVSRGILIEPEPGLFARPDA